MGWANKSSLEIEVGDLFWGGGFLCGGGEGGGWVLNSFSLLLEGEGEG